MFNHSLNNLLSVLGICLLCSCSASSKLARQTRLAEQHETDSLIALKQIRKGFTARQVKAAWGKPTYISSIGVEGDLRRLHQWVYEDRGYYTYFVGQKLWCAPTIFSIHQKKKEKKTK